MNPLFLILSVLILIISALLILIVLVQNSKGGGLASNFSASNQVMGVRKTTDFLEKATWGLAVGLVVLSVFASLSIRRGTEVEKESKIKNQVENAMDPNAMPVLPQQQQGQQQQQGDQTNASQTPAQTDAKTEEE